MTAVGLGTTEGEDAHWDEIYIEISKFFKTKDGSSIKEMAECQYDNSCPMEPYLIAIAVVIPVAILFGAVGFYFYREAKIRAKMDYDWIILASQLTFRRKKYDKDGNVIHAAKVEKKTEDGFSMGRSMGRSMGQSMGQSMGSMNMSMAAKKKALALSEHFGSYNKQKVLFRWSVRKHLLLTPRLLTEARAVRKVSHDNVATFIGGCLESGNVCIIYENCSKGPLDMMLEDSKKEKLEWTIRLSWIRDIVSAMSYLHGSPVGAHTRLTSKCCFIDSRFELKITDYGLPSVFSPTLSEIWTMKRSVSYAAGLLWTSPEKLRTESVDSHMPESVAKAGDVYSFSIILQEIVLISKPFSMYLNMTPIQIIEDLRRGTSTSGLPLRPQIQGPDVPRNLVILAEQCWSENASNRPSFDKCRNTLREIWKEMNMDESSNIMDTFLKQMEESEAMLETHLNAKDDEFIHQQNKTDDAYTKIFPLPIAEKVILEEAVEPIHYEQASVLLTEICGFETLCVESTPSQLIEVLNDLHDVFEHLCPYFNCFIVEQNVDCITVVSGISGESPEEGAGQIADLALESISELRKYQMPHRPTEQFKVRIGVSSGPVIATVIDHAAPRYAVCGRTLEVVKRLTKTAEQLKIHASEQTKNLLKGDERFTFSVSPLKSVYVSDDLDVNSYYLEE